LKQKKLSLEITCLAIHPRNLAFVDNENTILVSNYRRIIPNIYKYQKDEVATLINDSPDSELDMSKSVLRWLMRELVKNTKFFFESLYQTYRYEIELSEFTQLPIYVQGQDGKQIWINRNTLNKGVAPSDLEGTLEESRLKNPYQFNALLRKVHNSEFDYDIFEPENYSLELIERTDPRNRSFLLEVVELCDAKIFHAKLVVSTNQIVAMSNRRNVMIPRKPAFINFQDGYYQVFKLFKNSKTVSRSIYLGTSTNWFHFIVELAARIIELPETLRNGTPIVIEKGSHKNIVRLCELMTGVPPIQLAIGEAINVERLFIVREFGVGDPIDPIQRSHILKDFKDQIIGKVQPGDVNEFKKIYLRRPRNLYRPLQNENQVARTLHEDGFVSIYPEEHLLDDFIKIIQSAEYVVAESGAAITNLMFAQEGTKFLEILPAIAIIDFWKNFVEIFGIKYSVIQGKTDRIGSKGYAYDGYSISIENLRAKLSIW
jgi:hypothetical protein